MKKKDWYWIWCINLCFFIACANPNNKTEYFNQKLYDLDLNQTVKKIYVLTGNKCLGCNYKLAHTMYTMINDSTSILIVNVSPTYLDVSPFKNKYNVRFNFHPDDTFFQSSKIIYLNKGKINHIIPINIRSTPFLHDSLQIKKFDILHK